MKRAPRCGPVAALRGQGGTPRPAAGRGLVAIGLLALANVQTVSAASPHQAPTPALREAIHACADYLSRAARDDGQFVYRVNLDATVRPKPRYNMLRHAGAMLALADYESDYPSPRTRGVLTRTARFMAEQAIAPCPDDPARLAVWSDPAIHRGDGPRQAKLGGAGLGLAALARLAPLDAAAARPAMRQGLARFIVFMQQPDGSFHSKYIPTEDWRSLTWRSLYYPGEAALGLLLHARHDAPADAWTPAAVKTLAFLADRRAGRDDFAIDHWAIIAAAALMAAPAPGLAAADRDKLVADARHQCRAILRDAAALPRAPGAPPALTPDRRTTPTATRLEALLAAMAMIPADDHALRDAVWRTAGHGIAFLLQAQVPDGPHHGGITRSGDYLRRPAAATPAADSRAGEIRIDYVQHALSAMLAYERLARVAPSP